MPGLPFWSRSLKLPVKADDAVAQVRVDRVDRRRHEVGARRVGDASADVCPEPLDALVAGVVREELAGRQVEALLQAVRIVERHEGRHLGRPRLLVELRLGLVGRQVEGRPHVVRVERGVVVARQAVDQDAVRPRAASGGGQCEIRLERPVVRRLHLAGVREVLAVRAGLQAAEERDGVEGRHVGARSGEWVQRPLGRARRAGRAGHRIGRRRSERAAAASAAGALADAVHRQAVQLGLGERLLVVGAERRPREVVVPLRLERGPRRSRSSRRGGRRGRPSAPRRMRRCRCSRARSRCCRRTPVPVPAKYSAQSSLSAADVPTIASVVWKPAWQPMVKKIPPRERVRSGQVGGREEIRLVAVGRQCLVVVVVAVPVVDRGRAAGRERAERTEQACSSTTCR